MPIYTRTGDAGETGLRCGSRVSKNHPRVRAYGEIDELNACLGQALAELPPGNDFSPMGSLLSGVQNRLFDIGAELADPESSPATKSLDAAETQNLEKAIDAYTQPVPVLKNFILPGGARFAAALHVARCVCRRAEREVVALGAASPPILSYLNRLSDLLFTLARWVNYKLNVPEIPWAGK